jgi:simple sugar transport system permease protein
VTDTRPVPPEEQAPAEATALSSESPPGPPAPPPGRSRDVAIARLRDLALIPAILAIGVVGYAVSPVFLTHQNLVNVLQQQSEIALVVLAEAMILIAGKFDLSLESTVGLAPGFAAWLVLPPGVAHGLGLVPGAWSVPIVLAAGAVIGAFNGLLIVRFGLNAFIVTLGMLITLRGLLTGISGGKTFFNLPASFRYLGTATWAGLPASIWICLLAYAVGIAVLALLRPGRALYAIGGNTDAARAAGIRTGRALWLTLVAGGMLAALAGLLLSGRLASVASSQGNGWIFTVFAAAVIGGVSLNGGKGTLFGAFTGILLLYLIQNVLTLAGVPSQWIDALNGGIILVALVLARVTTGKTQE